MIEKIWIVKAMRASAATRGRGITVITMPPGAEEETAPLPSTAAEAIVVAEGATMVVVAEVAGAAEEGVGKFNEITPFFNHDFPYRLCGAASVEKGDGPRRGSRRDALDPAGRIHDGNG